VSAAVRVFVNERPLDVPPGATARDALAAADPELAGAVDAGLAFLTDGVGRPLTPDTPVGPGAILRAARSARRAGADVAPHA